MYILFVIILQLAHSSPVPHYQQLSLKEAAILAQWDENDQHHQNVWQLSGQFEGDMVLGHNQRNGITDESLKWPSREIPFEVSPDFTEAQKIFITESLEKEFSKTCIKVRPRLETDVDYVYVTGTNSGCWSNVGRMGERQQLNLQLKGCLWHATIVHEFLHAAGFYHQQSAADRDDYVDILWQNIISGAEHNFQKYDQDVVTSFGEIYDYNSVMHYDKYAFSANGEPTIIPKDENVAIGQRIGLSKIDILKLNKMYNCL